MVSGHYVVIFVRLCDLRGLIGRTVLEASHLKAGRRPLEVDKITCPSKIKLAKIVFA